MRILLDGIVDVLFTKMLVEEINHLEQESKTVRKDKYLLIVIKVAFVVTEVDVGNVAKQIFRNGL